MTLVASLKAMVLPKRKRPRAFVAGVAVIPVAVLLSLGTAGHPRSFQQLRADAAAVPVPNGVVFLNQTSSIEDGPGFTTTKFEEVTRRYQNSLSCSALSHVWSRALRRRGREFRSWDHPHMFGDAGQFGIDILDRSEHLGVTLGQELGGARHCATPFIFAYYDPH